MSTDDRSSPAAGRRPADRAIARVDLGAGLKAAAQAASDGAGATLSEWIRQAIHQALPVDAKVSPAALTLPVAHERTAGPVAWMQLDEAITTRLDALAARGRFRTRTGVLRALLDGVPVGESSKALREACGALGESNYRLADVMRDLARVARGVGVTQGGAAQRLAVERALGRVDEHLDLAARVVAGLRSQLLAKEE